MICVVVFFSLKSDDRNTKLSPQSLKRRNPRFVVLATFLLNYINMSHKQQIENEFYYAFTLLVVRNVRKRRMYLPTQHHTSFSHVIIVFRLHFYKNEKLLKQKLKLQNCIILYTIFLPYFNGNHCRCNFWNNHSFSKVTINCFNIFYDAFTKI